MKTITLPLVSGNSVTLFVGNNGLAVIDSTKTPGTCRVIDGLHNNGGWEVKMTREACVKKIQAALSN